MLPERNLERRVGPQSNRIPIWVIYNSLYQVTITSTPSLELTRSRSRADICRRRTRVSYPKVDITLKL